MSRNPSHCAMIYLVIFGTTLAQYDGQSDLQSNLTMAWEPDSFGFLTLIRNPPFRRAK
jgi:hypothetical protein